MTQNPKDNPKDDPRITQQGRRQQRSARHSQRARCPRRDPLQSGPQAPIPHDTEIYRWRHLVENLFQKIKEFRRIATRYDKTDTSNAVALYLVGAVLALK